MGEVLSGVLRGSLGDLDKVGGFPEEARGFMRRLGVPEEAQGFMRRLGVF